MFSEKVRAATGQLLWTNDYSYCLGNNVALHTYKYKYKYKSATRAVLGKLYLYLY